MPAADWAELSRLRPPRNCKAWVQLGSIWAAIVPGTAAWPTTGQVPTELEAPVPTAALTALPEPLPFSWKDGARNEVPTALLIVRP